MKIVSWNAACKFREKFDAVLALGADLYVIQECEDPQRSMILNGKIARKYSDATNHWRKSALSAVNSCREHNL